MAMVSGASSSGDLGHGGMVMARPPPALGRHPPDPWKSRSVRWRSRGQRRLLFGRPESGLQVLVADVPIELVSAAEQQAAGDALHCHRDLHSGQSRPDSAKPIDAQVSPIADRSGEGVPCGCQSRPSRESWLQPSRTNRSTTRTNRSISSTGVIAPLLREGWLCRVRSVKYTLILLIWQ